MTEQKWEELGYGSEFLGPGQACWSKVLLTGQHIVVTDADEEKMLPSENGPFRIGLYHARDDSGELVGCVDVRGSDELLVAILKSIESILPSLPISPGV